MEDSRPNGQWRRQAGGSPRLGNTFAARPGLGVRPSSSPAYYGQRSRPASIRIPQSQLSSLLSDPRAMREQIVGLYDALEIPERDPRPVSQIVGEMFAELKHLRRYCCSRCAQMREAEGITMWEHEQTFGTPRGCRDISPSYGVKRVSNVFSLDDEDSPGGSPRTGRSVSGETKAKRDSGIIMSAISSVTQNDLPAVDDEAVTSLLAGSKTMAELVERLSKSDATTQANVVKRLLHKCNQMQLLLDAVKEFSSEIELDSVYSKIIEVGYKILHPERVTLFVVDPERDELWCKISQDASGIRIPMGSGLAGHVALHGEALNIKDAYKDARFNQEVDKKTGFRTKSVLAVPVKDNDGDIVGVIQAINKLPPDAINSGPKAENVESFDPYDESLLNGMALQAGMSLRQSQLFEAGKQQHQVAKALLELVKSVTTDMDLTTVVRNICNAAYRLLNIERCTLFLADYRTRELVVEVSKDAEGFRVPFGAGFVGACVDSGDIINVPDAYADPRFNREMDAKTGFRTKSVLCYPIVDHRSDSGQVIAVLQAVNRKHDSGTCIEFSQGDLALVRGLASQAAVAIQNSRLFNESKEMLQYNKLILSSISSVVLAFNTDGMLMACNHPISKIFGFSEVEMQGRHYSECLEGLSEAHQCLAQDIAAVYNDPTKNIVRKDIELEVVSRVRAFADPPRRQSASKPAPESQPKDEAPDGGVEGDSGEKDESAGNEDKASTPPSASPPPGARSSDVESAGQTAPTEGEASDESPKDAGDEAGGSASEPVPQAADETTKEEASSRRDSALSDGVKTEVTVSVVNYKVAALRAPLDPTTARSARSKSQDVLAGVVVTVDDITELRQMAKRVLKYQQEEEEAENLRREIESSSETPFQGIQRMLKEVVDQSVTDDDDSFYFDAAMHSRLNSCLKLLRKKDLFRPAFANTFKAANKHVGALLHDYTATDSSQVLATTDWIENISLVDSESFRRWDFDPFVHSEEELFLFVLDVFKGFGLLARFEIPEDKLKNFIVQVRRHYHENPYHNFQHAVSVLQVVYMILTNTPASSKFSMHQILAMITASLVHDVDHPGVNNAHMCSAERDLATTYNDISVLENHHAALAFNIMHEADNNIFCNLSRDVRLDVRKAIIGCVLSTDMAHHFECVTKFKSQIEGADNPLDSFRQDNKDELQLLMSILVHAADLSNPIIPFDICKKWSHRVVEEFHNQAKIESEMSLPLTPSVAPFLEPPDLQRHATVQISFIDYVVAPLWEPLGKVFPDLRVCLDNLFSNRKKWELYRDGKLTDES